MYRILISLLITLLFCNCKNYENKDEYDITVGETFEIYYSTNSCCYYCISNKQQLKHTELLRVKVVDDEQKNCIGCNTIAAFVFKAQSEGTEIIELKKPTATTKCDTINDIKTEKYTIRIRNNN